MCLTRQQTEQPDAHSFNVGSSQPSCTYAAVKFAMALARSGAGLALTLAKLVPLLALPRVGICHFLITEVVHTQAARQRQGARRG